MSIAFYAPLKPPTHKTPSGDREMARLMMTALDRAGFDVSLASELRTRDGKGDSTTQAKLAEQADREVERLIAGPVPNLWFTYHCYYKAPDLIGPRVAEAHGIPYVIAEASRAKKRLSGPWAGFAITAEIAIDAADILFAMTDHDRFALDRDRKDAQQIIALPPFLDPSSITVKPQMTGDTLQLLTVAMMRSGAKFASYKRLAAALPHLEGAWHLTIIGDGDKRADVEALFADFGKRITFLGRMDAAKLRQTYAEFDLFVWPGVNEAYGMVYLEAQAAGLPVVAEDHPGPRSVIAQPLAPPNDPEAFAQAIQRAATTPSDPRAHILANHSLNTAAATLRTTLEPLL